MSSASMSLDMVQDSSTAMVAFSRLGQRYSGSSSSSADARLVECALASDQVDRLTPMSGTVADSARDTFSSSVHIACHTASPYLPPNSASDLTVSA